MTTSSAAPQSDQPQSSPSTAPSGGAAFPVPPHRWGSDHLSTLLYLETVVVDHKGLFDHIRGQYAARMRGPEYPCKLRDGEMPGHSDFDCLEDLRAAGLLGGFRRNAFADFRAGSGPNPAKQPHTPVTLTAAGWRLAHLLRRRRGERIDGLPSVEEIYSAICRPLAAEAGR